MRFKIVAGNWKMNQTLEEGKNLAQTIKSQEKEIPEDVKTIIIPPFIHLSEISKILEPSSIRLGAQNCADEEKGAYTGEVSAVNVGLLEKLPGIRWFTTTAIKNYFFFCRLLCVIFLN